MESVEEEFVEEESTSNKFVCPICHKPYTSKYNLNAHSRNSHGAVSSTTSEMSFECDLCPTFCYTRNQLLSHYYIIHDKQLKQFIDFKSHDDFSNWKDMLEKEKGHFFRMKGNKKSSKMNAFYYACHRSYKNQKGNESNRTKRTKSQGSKISSKHCISYLIARQNVYNDEVYVEYCLEHTHHLFEKCHLPISNLRKKEIISKLDEGVPVEEIVESIRSQAQPEPHRDDLVTKTDVRNIQRHLKDRCQKYSTSFETTEFTM